ncbi:MAG: prephenate dehydratase [Gemmatimonadetes bacterium]|nr:prephenate dehydratase [Gemmatimonadota bacterium]
MSRRSAARASAAPNATGADPVRHLVRVAYQGEPGAFSEEAIRAHFGERAHPVPCRRFEDAGRLLARGGVDFAVLPVENSSIGVIHDAVAVMERYELREVGTRSLSVRHCLLGLAGARIDTVRAVHSQAAALAQCARFLRAHGWMRCVPAIDTAGAARDIARARDPALTAIASRSAATHHGLDILAADIQDDPENRTWFVILASCGQSSIARQAAVQKSVWTGGGSGDSRDAGSSGCRSALPPDQGGRRRKESPSLLPVTGGISTPGTSAPVRSIPREPG